ncbi:MAG: hypothetical protein JNK23_00180 [Opitutaceae bacterium]|nr:hypothetical protein [Opitutaceae bacterium]
MRALKNTVRFAAVVLVLGASGDAAEGGVTALDPFTVKTDRFEDFGFSADDAFPESAPSRRSPLGNPIIGIVREVRPNTAAAKAGLKPGDRILKSDGSALRVSLIEENKWHKLTWEKFVEARAGKEVKWTLAVQSADSNETRTITLVVPSPPPRWGASIWQAPAGRTPATVNESGPLADRALEVLNSGVWAMLDASLARSLGLPAEKTDPILGFYWDIQVPPNQRSRMLHRMFVSQRRGRTEIILTVRSATDRGFPAKHFLTSPSGVLEKAWGNWDKKITGGKSKSEEIPRDQAASGFQQEIDFWLKRVGKVTPRWPMELIPEK